MKEFKLRTDLTKIRFDSIDGEAFYTDADEIAYIEKGKKPLPHESFADPAEFVSTYYVQLKHRNTPVEVSQEDYTWLARKLYPEVIEEEQHDSNV